MLLRVIKKMSFMTRQKYMKLIFLKRIYRKSKEHHTRWSEERFTIENEQDISIRYFSSNDVLHTRSIILQQDDREEKKLTNIPLVTASEEKKAQTENWQLAIDL